MTLFTVITLLSYTIIPAFVIALSRIRHCRTSYMPFLVFILVSFANEVISSLSIWLNSNNCINANIFVLVEFGLILWQFSNWHQSQNKRWWYMLIGCCGGILWLTEMLLINPAAQFNSVFRITYACSLVLLAGNRLGFLVINDHHIFKNPRFIIMVSFLVQYTYKTCSELLFAIDPGFSPMFYTYFLLIWSGINAFINLLYIPAVLWIPTKQKHCFSFSSVH